MPVSAAPQVSAVARLADLALPGRVHFGVIAAEPLRRLSSGVESVDAVLNGGVPCGRLSEILGPLSSGKTSLLFRLLATTTRRGEVVACVDLADALHPESAAGAGVDLHQFLWVRPPSVVEALRCTELLLQAGGFAVVALDLGAVRPRALHSRIWSRLLRTAEQSHTALIVLAPQQVAGSFAVLSLQLHPRQVQWQSGQWALFEGFDSTLRVVRNKLGAPGRWAALRVRESQGPRVPQWDLIETLDPSTP
jgi:hypothetical protein